MAKAGLIAVVPHWTARSICATVRQRSGANFLVRACASGSRKGSGLASDKDANAAGGQGTGSGFDAAGGSGPIAPARYIISLRMSGALSCGYDGTGTCPGPVATWEHPVGTNRTNTAASRLCKLTGSGSALLGSGHCSSHSPCYPASHDPQRRLMHEDPVALYAVRSSVPASLGSSAD